MKVQEAYAQYKDEKYALVAVVANQRCRQHQAVLVSAVVKESETTKSADGGEKYLHCPFCQKP
jgi:hypothetical protein